MRKGDLYIGIIILVIMVLLGLGYKLYIYSLGSERFVVVKVDGLEQKRIKLTKDVNLTFTVLTENGEIVGIEDGEVKDSAYDYNIVHIYNGGVEVMEADCANQQDVEIGFIDKPGRPIICVPHHLHIEIVGGDSDTPTVDAGT